ncbi:MAG TPA: sialidase family protein [Planctomycetota bacterium]|nr:sialidase family protein [Planctomycetota bacterium]
MPRLLLVLFVCVLNVAVSAAETLDYKIELTTATKLFDGKVSWCHPRAGAIPPGAVGNPSDKPIVVMTLQHILLSASDVFYCLNQMRTEDLGKTWSAPTPIAGFERRPYKDKYEITVCDFTPRFHAASGRLLGTGHTVMYENNKILEYRPRDTAYSIYDAVKKTWSPWQSLTMPNDPKFACAGAGSTQRLDLPNGDILLPIYFKRLKAKQYASTVVRCRLEGETLKYVEHGSELTIDVQRGLFEPSITQFKGKFYLTMRNDVRGYVSVSDDGLKYSEPKAWTWDDGSDLGTYNTQQHWVAHSDALFLVYTRKGAKNDHVFRHRAPLFIAQIDPEKLCVIRATEKELMPNRGARLGNFAITEVSANETWVTDAEWMQPKGVEKHGADGSVWVSKIHWSKPNGLMKP